MESEISIDHESQTEAKPVLCGVLFHIDRKRDFEDVSGCLKPQGHNDAHICQTSSGKFMEWEDDYSCECGCWDDDDGKPCATYREVSNPT
jgi:hypothetical protein